MGPVTRLRKSIVLRTTTVMTTKYAVSPEAVGLADPNAKERAREVNLLRLILLMSVDSPVLRR